MYENKEKDDNFEEMKKQYLQKTAEEWELLWELEKERMRKVKASET